MTTTNRPSLFPTFSMIDFDAESSLLEIVDDAGMEAAEAFDRELAGQDDDREARRRAFQELVDVLVDDPGVPRSTRRLVARILPKHWKAIVPAARQGRLSAALLPFEMEERAAARVWNEPADPKEHPILAAVDRYGQEAAKAALAAFREKVPIGEAATIEAHAAAREAWLGALARKGLGDIVDEIRDRVPPNVLWPIVLTAAAGVLGSLLVGPKRLLGALDQLGMEELGLSLDFDVAQIGDDVRVRAGGRIVLLPSELADGPLWKQALGDVVGSLEANATLRFDALDVGASLSYAPRDRDWGVKITFTLAKF